MQLFKPSWLNSFFSQYHFRIQNTQRVFMTQLTTFYIITFLLSRGRRQGVPVRVCPQCLREIALEIYAKECLNGYRAIRCPWGEKCRQVFGRCGQRSPSLQYNTGKPLALDFLSLERRGPDSHQQVVGTRKATSDSKIKGKLKKSLRRPVTRENAYVKIKRSL